MTKRVRVEVTAEDIAKGKRNKPWSCPIARAVRRTLRTRWARVWVDYVNWGRWDRQNAAELPAMAIRFIAKFDRRRSVRPFAFTLKLPKPHGDALGEREKL